MIRSVLLLSMMIAWMNSFAQLTENAVDNTAAGTDSSMVFTDAKGTYVCPKVYLKWAVKNQQFDGVYIVEMKKDGRFVPVADKEATGITADFAIVHLATILDPSYKTSEFRIRSINSEGKEIISESFSVDPQVKLNYEFRSVTSEGRGKRKTATL